MQEICSSNPPVVTEICDPNKSRARHNRTLRNNNFKFCKVYFNQTEGTAMRTKRGPPYACFAVNYKQETKMFLTELSELFLN